MGRFVDFFIVVIIDFDKLNCPAEPTNCISLGTSKVSIPELLPNPFILHIESNNLGRAKENAYTIFDGMGKIFYSKPEFQDSTTYDEVITLEDGCYTLLLTDKQLDGMMQHWWERVAHPDRIGISGRIMIVSMEGDTLKKFTADFGTELRCCFRVANSK